MLVKTETLWKGLGHFIGDVVFDCSAPTNVFLLGLDDTGSQSVL
jgi:hypothetical protein